VVYEYAPPPVRQPRPARRSAHPLHTTFVARVQTRLNKLQCPGWTTIVARGHARGHAAAGDTSVMSVMGATRLGSAVPAREGACIPPAVPDGLRVAASVATARYRYFLSSLL
jgi:hypothetical protein